jgi:hypothetical protein
MSLIDRMKEQAEQTARKARAGAQDVQAKAHSAADQVQARQELNKAYIELGTTTAELLERGELSHPDLATTAARIDELKARLERAGGDDAGPTAEAEV